MMLIATVGLLANLISAWSLMRQGDVKGNVNLRSAYLHVLGDALGSIGAIVAGFLMMLFGWYIADPIISVVVSVLILKSAWGVLAHSVYILMEGSPEGVDHSEIKNLLENIEGVKDVHEFTHLDDYLRTGLIVLSYARRRGKRWSANFAKKPSI